MKKRISMQLMCLILLFAVMGCSSSDNNPVAPPNSDAEINLPVSQVDETQTNRSLLGMWTATFDLENLSVSLTPYRELGMHFNVTAMLPALLLSINSYDPQTGIVDVDVSITNPYQINAYDVRLIIYTDGTGHKLENPDNWTALYDISGGLPINPFKAYAKSTPNRIFEGQTQHTENLLIYLPAGDPNVIFAIDASYPENCEEPYKISNFTHDDIYGFAGSSALAEIDVYDWQDDVDSVLLMASEITDELFTQFTEQNRETWSMVLTNNTGANTGDYEGLIIGLSENSSSQYLYEFVAIHISEAELSVSEIDGSSNIYETECEIYSIDANGDTGITYQWTCCPSWAGEFDSPNNSTSNFCPNNIDNYQSVLLKVEVNSDHFNPIIRQIEVLISEHVCYFPPEIIYGPLSMIEGTCESYVAIVGDPQTTTYFWSCDPWWAGYFTEPYMQSTKFCANFVDEDTVVGLRVDFDTDHCLPFYGWFSIKIIDQ